ncbi:MAG: hypothetical protein RMJ05_06975 [Thermomicrobium sp.]|nr:hypothetical protein [Thermomicrobium sp.]MDW8060008.1 hypothetical protein [Thermomicrobium sp.]
MREIVLVLPLPPATLSPNARVHVLDRAKAARLVREDTRRLARSALAEQGLDEPRWARALVRYRWRASRGPMPDPDNLIARCKPVLDGIVAAGALASDRDVTISVEYERVATKRDEGLVVVVSAEG